MLLACAGTGQVRLPSGLASRRSMPGAVGARVAEAPVSWSSRWRDQQRVHYDASTANFRGFRKAGRPGHPTDPK